MVYSATTVGELREALLNFSDDSPVAAWRPDEMSDEVAVYEEYGRVVVG